jgi:hypothetical protein
MFFVLVDFFCYLNEVTRNNIVNNIGLPASALAYRHGMVAEVAATEL